MSRILLLLLVFLLTGCTRPRPVPIAWTSQGEMPNPASAFCEQQGNRLEIRTAADGSQSGVCIFPDGSECDEWAYYRGECRAAAPALDLATPPPSPALPKPTIASYAPGLVTPDASAYAGWVEYADQHYGFKFRYPPEWEATLDLRSDSTSYQHLLWLRAPSKPVDGVVMSIAFEAAGEDYGLQRTGIGAGELLERGSVLFLGEPAKRIVLSLEGLDMEVMYAHTGLFDRGDLRFAVSLSYIGDERRGLTPALEQTADLIVASFERTR